jgi:GNAT superfamily N-acetyltransferase
MPTSRSPPGRVFFNADEPVFALVALRGQGIGRLLIEAVSAQARQQGAKRLYWQTNQTNATGRLLYDKVAQHEGSIVYNRDL